VRRATDVLAFGLNDKGQLGAGSNNVTSTIDVVGLTTAVALAAGADHSLALLADGTVVAWGDNSKRQLGYHPGRVQRVPLSIGDLTAADDADADGMQNAWETAKAVTSVSAAADGDGDLLNTIQEFHLGTWPHFADTDNDMVSDFVDSAPRNSFNANTPLLVVLGGDQQAAPANQYNAEPFDVAVWEASRGDLMAQENKPVVFTVTNMPSAPAASGMLTATNPASALSTRITVVTDADGTAQVWFKQPSLANFTSFIGVTAGVEAYEFISFSTPLAPIYTPPSFNLTPSATDTDADGIPNAVETAAGLNQAIPAQTLFRNQTLPNPVPYPGAPASSTLRFITLTPCP
jgi:hypothetical protein